jgi:hypothetical protein
MATSRAPKICSEVGCAAMVYDQAKRKCDRHYVPWKGRRNSFGTHDNTAQRKTLKDSVFRKANGVCQLGYDGCERTAKVLDRIDNSMGYSPSNCQAACSHCSAIKSSHEGHSAKGNQIEPLPAPPPTPKAGIPKRIKPWKHDDGEQSFGDGWTGQW